MGGALPISAAMQIVGRPSDPCIVSEGFRVGLRFRCCCAATSTRVAALAPQTWTPHFARSATMFHRGRSSPSQTTGSWGPGGFCSVHWDTHP
jgi:hypothetical protein